MPSHPLSSLSYHHSHPLSSLSHSHPPPHNSTLQANEMERPQFHGTHFEDLEGAISKKHTSALGHSRDSKLHSMSGSRSGLGSIGSKRKEEENEYRKAYPAWRRLIRCLTLSRFYGLRSFYLISWTVLILFMNLPYICFLLCVIFCSCACLPIYLSIYLSMTLSVSVCLTLPLSLSFTFSFTFSFTS